MQISINPKIIHLQWVYTFFVLALFKKLINLHVKIQKIFWFFKGQISSFNHLKGLIPANM